MEGGRCNFFVVKKKRSCRMTVKPGELYCGEHRPSDGEITKNTSVDLRVPCPLDSKHTCFTSKLEKHLKVCNAREKDLPSFISKNCNILGTKLNIAEEQTRKRSLSNVPESELKTIIATIEKIFNDCIHGNIIKLENMQPHPCVKDEIENDLRKDNSRRHFIQTSSLLNIIENNGLLVENTCFVELGAGRGQVSYYLAAATAKVSQCSVALVDRASHRHKRENKLDKDANNILRVRADIADLFLSELPVVKTSNHVVGVSKHLCGTATDLALQCLTNPNVYEKTRGIIMATCCHHRCCWSSYVGKSFLESHNVNQDVFHVICGLVSWATCGTGLSRERRAELLNKSNAKDCKKAKIETDDNVDSGILQNEQEKTSQCSETSNDDCNRRHLGLSLQERAEIGFKAKAVLDWGRLVFLKDHHNFEANLCFYVEKSVSPENVCIVAIKKS